MTNTDDPMDTDDLVYHVDGDLVPASEACVSVDDRGFRYGDAAFETCRVYGGTVFEWEAHAARLERTCAALSIDHDLSADELRARIDETLAANALADASVRLSITRGVQPGKLTPKRDVDPTVVITVDPLPRGGVGGEPVWGDRATVRTVSTRRTPEAAVPSAAKTHNYLNGILARLELRGTNADEALVCDLNGTVAEGATSNLWFVREGSLFTPTTDGPVLPGITRSVVRDLAVEADVAVHEGRYSVEDVYAADEAFLTNRTWELRPIGLLDDHVIGGGPVTDRLSQLYDERVERECYRP